MIQTVNDVSALGPLVDLLESFESILKHLDIFAKVPHTPAMTEAVVKTLVELLSILGLVTKLVRQGECLVAILFAAVTQCNAETFVEKPFGGNYDKMVLERLDRLTPDKGRITALEILRVVYGLVQNMSAVVDGEQTDLVCHPLALRNSPFRQGVIHRRYLEYPGYIC
jgi:hypothetical protein